VATAVFCGGIFGYICYDLTHYFLHHKTLPVYWQELKKYHLRMSYAPYLVTCPFREYILMHTIEHHFMDYENGFGVTSRFWDQIFGTQLAPPPSKVL
jgi:4-hydroxysphinganine ceramide fatty acyl 2-hydroxylase